MLSRWKILWLLLALLFGNTALRAATFTASLASDTIIRGEATTLSLTFEGGQSRNVPTPRVAGLQFTPSGDSRNYTLINGTMNSVITINYSVTAQHTGEFKIPMLTADVNGEELSTAPLTLTVTDPHAATTADINSGSQIAFLKLTLPKKKIYTGETLVADLQIYYRQETRLAQQPQITGFPLEGFTAGKIPSSNGRQVQVGNSIYNVIPARVALTAVKSGQLSIGPITINLVLNVPAENQPRDSIFAQMGIGDFDQKQFSLASDKISVEALPLPQQNVPPDFHGALGNFTVNVSVGPTNLTAGDPITMRVQISGRGNFDALTLPAQNDWHDFKTFAPTSKFEASDPFGIQGTKTFEQIVSPQNSDVHELPPFSFSFFNPDDGQYHTLTQPAVPLVVKAAAASPMPVLAAKNAAPENQTQPDILPIKENLGTLAKISSPLISQPVFLAAQTLPILAFLAAFIWRKRADNLANNPRLRRKIAVEKLVQNGIADLRKFASENNSEEFFALLFRLLQEQLGERLDCPASAITENVVEENSILRGASETTRNDLRELFQLCNQARYAPVRGTAELNSVTAQFEKTVGGLQEVKA